MRKATPVDAASCMSGSRENFPLAGRTQLKVRALFLGERLDLRTMETTSRIASQPLTFSVGKTGCAVLFRFGALVFFDVDSVDELSFMEGIRKYVTAPFAVPEHEEATVQIRQDAEEGALDDTIVLRECSVERIQLIAEILARAVSLNHYETKVDKSFDTIEPLALSLRTKGRPASGSKALLAQIADILLCQHTMVGRAEINDKPELLWDYPSLERLYMRLEGEYEISERYRAVEAKLEVLSRTTETVLELLRTRQSHRLEWYIIFLIVFEIFLSLYEMFLKPYLFIGN